MKITTAVLVLALGLSVVPARADTIIAKIPGADFSLPGTIGTFTYSLPIDSEITRLILFSPLYSFPPATEFLVLGFSFDGMGVVGLPMQPGDAEFFMGSELTYVVPSITWDGSLDLSVHCLLGPCPSTYTRASAEDWRLWIEAEPRSPIPDLGSSLLLLGMSLMGLRALKQRLG